MPIVISSAFDTIFQMLGINFFLFISLFGSSLAFAQEGVEHSSENVSVVEPSQTEILNRLASVYVQKLPQIVALTSPGCENALRKVPMPIQKPTPPPVNLKLYQCEAPGEVGEPKPKDKFVPVQTAALAYHNDNMATFYGSDYYYTLGVELDHSIQWQKDRKLTTNVGVKYYTLKATPNPLLEQKAKDLVAAGKAEAIAIHDGESDGAGLLLNFLSLTSLKSSFEIGDEVKYRFNGGIDIRNTEGVKSVGGVLQHTSHKLLNQYRYTYVPASGQAGDVVLVPSKGKTVASITGTAPNQYLENLSPVSFLAGADVSSTHSAFGGSCRAVLEVGGLIATEGKMLVGPNSYLHVKSGLSTTLTKSKSGKDRLQAAVNGSLLYFPSAGSEADFQHVGAEISGSIGNTFYLGKERKKTFTPSFALWLPSGAQAYQGVTTASPTKVIQTLKLSFGF